MYTFIVRGKSLSVTVSDATYANDSVANGIRILIADNCDAQLLYVVYSINDRSGIIETARMPNKYNSTFFDYRAPLTNDFTAQAGSASISVEVIYADGSHERTNNVTIPIHNSEPALSSATKIYSMSIGDLRFQLEKSIALYRSSDATLRSEINTVKQIAQLLSRKLSEVSADGNS